MLTRRELLARSAAGGLGLALGGRLPAYAAPPPALTPYADALQIPAPLPPFTTSGGAPTAFRVGVAQIQQRLHRDLDPATLWAYGTWDGGTGVTGASVPGPTMVVRRGVPVEVSYYNGLGGSPLFPEADPLIVARLEDGNGGAPPPAVRINTHFHGGHIAAAADGNPYHVPLAEETLPGETQVVRYANDQQAALAWYHDHAVGITRSNVMAGLAGGYLITDPPNEPAGLPPAEFDVPLIVQDRRLDLDSGEVVYPGPGVPAGRTWVPEFFGDLVLVNGVVWPYLEVEPRRYRFRILDGSNARFYNLRFFAAERGLLRVHQIGTDLGYLPEPAPIREVLSGPGERCDVLVDFSGVAGENVELRTMPLPAGTVSPATPLARRGIMQFRVRGRPVATGLPRLRARAGRRAATDGRIVHTLEEVMDPAGAAPLMALLDGKEFHDELGPDDAIANGATLEWDLVNLTADTHPIHLHLVHFEVVHRRRLDVRRYLDELAELRTNPEDEADVWDPVTRTGYRGWMNASMPDPVPFAAKLTVPPPRSERGPKDTVRANPGEVTRIRVTFAVPAGTPLPAKYVWHCHILEHEDNDMMRPYEVVAP